MAGLRLSRCLLQCVSLLLVCCNVVQCQEPKKDLCTEEDLIQLDGLREDEDCGLVEGRMQFCEEDAEGQRVWKHLCDEQFTVEDAQVICRSLGYSDIGATPVLEIQIVTGTTSGVNCSGAEDNFTECSRTSGAQDQEGMCEKSIGVMCFTTDMKAEQNCNTDNTTAPPPDPTDSTPDSTGRGPGTSTSPQTSPSSTVTSSNTIATTTDGSLGATDAENIFLSSPSLYYLIGGLIAFVLLIVLIVICSLFCCYGRGFRRKDISPTDPESGNRALHAGYAEDPLKKKDYTTTHHQIQQSSQPIYEAINSNEDSSTASQGSPSSKPVNPELYATLDQTNNTYAQIEPFIAAAGSTSAATSPVGPDPNSYYQPLDHRTGSMKRGLPSTPMQAVNATALAFAKGEVAEGELSEMTRNGGRITVGSSTSLPRNTGYSSSSISSTANHHPLPPHGTHLERVELREMTEQTNIYHILEPPPPEYSTLEQLEESSQVSTTAVCNNSSRPARVSQGSNRRSTEHSPPTFSQQRHMEGSPALIHPRSATLPSNHSSPRSSRTSSTSSSPHVNRSNRSPLNNRANQTGHGVVKTNKYSDSPSLTRGPSSSPQISQSPSKSNRFSSQSDGTEGNATLV